MESGGLRFGWLGLGGVTILKWDGVDGVLHGDCGMNLIADEGRFSLVEFVAGGGGVLLAILVVGLEGGLGVAVEWEGGGFCQGEFGKVVESSEIGDVGGGGFGEWEFADAVFDRDFSSGDRAEKNDVVGVIEDAEFF